MKPLTNARRSATGGWGAASCGWWLVDAHTSHPVLVGVTAVVCTLATLISVVNGLLEAAE